MTIKDFNALQCFTSHSLSINRPKYVNVTSDTTELFLSDKKRHLARLDLSHQPDFIIRFQRFLSPALHQIKSNQIYLPAQNIKETQLKNKVNTKNQRHTDYGC